MYKEPFNANATRYLDSNPTKNGREIVKREKQHLRYPNRPMEATLGWGRDSKKGEQFGAAVDS